MKQKNYFTVFSLAAFLSFASSSVLADNPVYQVTITNLTGNIIFTPILVASHRKGVKLFKTGQPASYELGRIAEGGDVVPMASLLSSNEKVIDVADSGGPLLPGDSVTVEVNARKGAKYISLASMMLPTNDGFIALNGVKAPRGRQQVTYLSPGYDAGTETNDELCANIPGPQCNGIPFSPDDEGEGYIFIHSGIHDIGDLPSATYDWRNPVASISIRRVKVEDDE